MCEYIYLCILGWLTMIILLIWGGESGMNFAELIIICIGGILLALNLATIPDELLLIWNVSIDNEIEY